MYNHKNESSFSQPRYDLPGQYTATELEVLSHNMIAETESSNLVGSGNYYSSGSGCSSYVGSPSSNSMASYGNHPPTTANPLFQRSTSSHSLYKGGSYCLTGKSEDSDDGPVRRVYSAGDLEGVNSYMAQRKQRADSPLSISKENSMIIEGMMKVSKYSPEEKRERIERYRSKRNLRNFNKKIQYECRKTLADSRTRIKGRFARNDEISTLTTTTITMEENSRYDNHLFNDQYSSTHQDHIMVAWHEDDEGEEHSWVNLLDYSFPSEYEH